MVQTDSILYKESLKKLEQREVELEEIAELVYDLQIPYMKNLTIEICLKYVDKVLKKREVQNAILTGVELDVLCEEGKLSQPLQQIIKDDEGLYGIDEVLALSIVNVSGSIGFTNFGYLDKMKPKVIKRLDDHKHTDHTHTFLDDIVGAIAAAAASRIAHANPEMSEIMQ